MNMTSASELYSKVCVNDDIRIKPNVMGWAYIIEKLLLPFLRCVFTQSYLEYYI